MSCGGNDGGFAIGHGSRVSYNGNERSDLDVRLDFLRYVILRILRLVKPNGSQTRRFASPQSTRVFELTASRGREPYEHDLSSTREAVPLGAPAPAQRQSGGLFSGLAGTMMQGAALGTGSAFAHRAVDAVMGGRESAPQEALSSEAGDVCSNQAKAFTDCITANNGDLAGCQFYFDMLQQCKAQM